MPARKSEDDYRRLAVRRRFEWLGPYPRNSKALTAWRCPNGHPFPASYNNVDRGMNCKFCAREETARQQRHSQAAYHALAQRRGIFWLGPPVNSALAQTVWECPMEHRWSARYNTVHNAKGNGCRRCGHERRATRIRRHPGEYRALAASRGFKWLGPTVKSTKQDTEWECEAGHRFKSTYNRLDQRPNGGGCRQCAGLAPLTSVDFHALASRRGFVWLGTAAVNSRTKSQWRCGVGHEWPATYSSVSGGSGCPPCSGNQRKTIEEFVQLAERRGFLWHGPLVPNSKTDTEWECPWGHRWFTTYNAIDQESGCLECTGRLPKTPEDYRRLAAERGFVWDEVVVANTSEKAGWTCAKGHLFQSAYNTIGAGHGCPSCLDMVNGAMVSRNQRLLCDMVAGELNGARIGRFVIDVTKRIGDIKIAVEYDTWFIHGPSNSRDLRKDWAMLAQGWRVLRIRTNSQLPSQAQLAEAINRLVGGELWIDIELDDWGIGRVAPWLGKSAETETSRQP